MMKTFAAASLALALVLAATPAPAAETVRPVPSSLGASGVMFDTRAKANGETYRIHVALPPGMEPGARYPVVYLLDADWHFPLMAETVRLLVEAGDIAPVIVVGIGYRVTRPMETITLRTRDFTVAGDRPHEELIRKIVGEGPAIRTGGAEAFLAFIQQELKPAIAARFPADNGRTALFGHSLGGTFGLNVLFRHPESFTAYGLSSPPVLWGEEEALKLEADRAARHGDLPAELMLSVGGDERTLAHVLGLPPAMKAEEEKMLAAFGNPDPAAQLMGFDSRLRGRAYPGLRYPGLAIYSGHGHGSVPIPAFAAGLLAFFKAGAGDGR